MPVKVNYLTGKYKLRCNTCNCYIMSYNDYGTIKRTTKSNKGNHKSKHYKHDLEITESYE